MESRISKAKKLLQQAFEIVNKDETTIQLLLEDVVLSSKSEINSAIADNSSALPPAPLPEPEPPAISDSSSCSTSLSSTHVPTTPAAAASAVILRSELFANLHPEITIKLQDSWTKAEQKMEPVSFASGRKVKGKPGLEAVFKVNLMDPETTVVLSYPPAFFTSLLREHITDLELPFENLPAQVLRTMKEKIIPNGLCYASQKLILNVLKQRYRKLNAKTTAKIAKQKKRSRVEEASSDDSDSQSEETQDNEAKCEPESTGLQITGESEQTRKRQKSQVSKEEQPGIDWQQYFSSKVNNNLI